MKLRLLAIACGFAALCSGSAWAQNTASTGGTATGSIIRPISVVEKHNLNFGTFTSPQGAGGGTITLNATGTVLNQTTGNAPPPTPTTTGGIATLNTPQTSGNGGEPVWFGVFQAKGEHNYYFSIVVPSGPQLLLDGIDASHYMTLTGFTTSEPGNVGQLTQLSAGMGFRYFAVGATLNAAQYQATGYYSGTYTVTVSYN